MTKDTIFQTERLKISIPTIHNLNNWYKLLSDADVMKYIGDGKPKNRIGAKESLQKTIDHYKKNEFSFFDIYEKDTDTFIGTAGLIHLAFDENNKDIEVGYTLHKKYWGKGYATELAQTFIHWGFKHLHLSRIVACCEPENIASSNVIKKCNMKYNGKYLYKGKNECDIYVINNIIIKTKHFYLRPFHEKEDFDLIYNLWNDKDILKSVECAALNKTKIESKLNNYKMWMNRFGITNLAVFTKKSNDFVGSCGISLFHDPDNDRNPLTTINSEKYFNMDMELGYILRKKYWGKGYATELAQAVVDFVFKNYSDIKRIVAITVLNNIASQKVLSKVGFKFIKEIDSKKYEKEKFYAIYRKQK